MFDFLIWSKIVRDVLFSLVFTRHKEGSGPLTAGSSPLVASTVSQTPGCVTYTLSSRMGKMYRTKL